MKDKAKAEEPKNKETRNGRRYITMAVIAIILALVATLSVPYLLRNNEVVEPTNTVSPTISPTSIVVATIKPALPPTNVPVVLVTNSPTPTSTPARLPTDTPMPTPTATSTPEPTLTPEKTGSPYLTNINGSCGINIRACGAYDDDGDCITSTIPEGAIVAVLPQGGVVKALGRFEIDGSYWCKIAEPDNTQVIVINKQLSDRVYDRGGWLYFKCSLPNVRQVGFPNN